jgi:hypothetical protein
VDDARRVLEEAVRDRRACRVQRPGGEWVTGTLVRLESGGVVVSAPGHALRGGEEVRLWFDEDGRSLHFEASVLRAGVPVPDRGAAGLLIGFLAAVTAPPETPPEPATAAPVLELHLGTGSPVSLLAAPVELVEIDLHRLQFQVPRTFRVVFPENGALRLRIGGGASEPIEARGRVHMVVAGESTLLYAVDLEEVERHDRHQQAVRALRAALGR